MRQFLDLGRILCFCADVRSIPQPSKTKRNLLVKKQRTSVFWRNVYLILPLYIILVTNGLQYNLLSAAVKNFDPRDCSQAISHFHCFPKACLPPSLVLLLISLFSENPQVPVCGECKVSAIKLLIKRTRRDCLSPNVAQLLGSCCRPKPSSCFSVSLTQVLTCGSSGPQALSSHHHRGHTRHCVSFCWTPEGNDSITSAEAFSPLILLGSLLEAGKEGKTLGSTVQGLQGEAEHIFSALNYWQK